MNDLASLRVVNEAEFQAVFRKYLAVTPRELSQAINQKMFYISRGASRLSPEADKSAIERELGVAGHRVMTRKTTTKHGWAGSVRINKKTGKAKIERVMDDRVAWGAMIVNARRGRAGKKGLYGSKMRSAISKMIGKRVRSVGTVQAGWINAIRVFGKAAGESSYSDNIRRLKGGTSTTVAKPGWNPEASIGYNVNSYTQQHQQYIDRLTSAALARAYADEMKSMEKYIIDKLQKQANRLSK